MQTLSSLSRSHKKQALKQGVVTQFPFHMSAGVGGESLGGDCSRVPGSVLIYSPRHCLERGSMLSLTVTVT